METRPQLVPIRFLPARVNLERRPDGIIILRSTDPPRPYARCLGEYLERWAAEKPDEVFLAEREAEIWRKITWAETRALVYAIATSLLERGLSTERPVVVLSDNSIEHALLALAAMHIGVPIAPVSPAYSLMSQDFAKLRTIVGLIEPRLIFVDDETKFARALVAIRHHDFELITSRNMNVLTGRTGAAAVARAFAA